MDRRDRDIVGLHCLDIHIFPTFPVRLPSSYPVVFLPPRIEGLLNRSVVDPLSLPSKLYSHDVFPRNVRNIDVQERVVRKRMSQGISGNLQRTGGGGFEMVMPAGNQGKSERWDTEDRPLNSGRYGAGIGDIIAEATM
jgi:hypothetical protein